MATNRYRPEASSFALKTDAIKAMRARSAPVVGSRSSWSFRNRTLSKATLFAGASDAAATAERGPTARDAKTRNAVRAQRTSAALRGASGPQPAGAALLDPASASQSRMGLILSALVRTQVPQLQKRRGR